jgi:heme exporter protein D
LGKDLLINLKFNTAMDSFAWGDFVIYLLIVIGIWVVLRPVVLWYNGTNETHRLLRDILDELKRKNEQ